MMLVASISVCAAFLWVLINMRGRVGPRVRPMAMMCVFIIALAAANILRSAAGSLPQHMLLNAIATVIAAGALAMALAREPRRQSRRV